MTTFRFATIPRIVAKSLQIETIQAGIVSILAIYLIKMSEMHPIYLIKTANFYCFYLIKSVNSNRKEVLKMKRFLMDELVKWKNSSGRKPLLLQGARQVGKTWLMKEFGKQYFENVAYINFDDAENMRTVFDRNYNIPRILLAINAFTGERIEPEKTLIIFDEVQEAPRAISSLKYFCENAPEYAVIASGSYLGIARHAGISYPVGKVDLLTLYPMNFREFMLADGHQNFLQLLDENNYETVATFAEDYKLWLKQYLFVGGMPEVVSDFVEHHDFTSVREKQNRILAMYETDFGKHASERELTKLRMAWESIAVQLGKDNKKFVFADVSEGARAATYENAIQWLCDNGLVYKLRNVSAPRMPLKAYEVYNNFKLYLLDVGLLGARVDLPARTIIDGSDIFVEFKGALTEQYVMQQLVSDTNFNPFFFRKTQHNEIAFLVQGDFDIVPVEVKSGNVLKSRSLLAYIDAFHPKKAIRFSLHDYHKDAPITEMPLYAIHNLENEIRGEHI